MILKAAEISTLCFLEGRTPTAIRVETTNFQDAAGKPIVVIHVEGFQFLVRAHELVALAEVFKDNTSEPIVQPRRSTHPSKAFPTDDR